jgi:hypothetical protein
MGGANPGARQGARSLRERMGGDEDGAMREMVSEIATIR